jgi:hypothetical protein
MIVRVAHGLSPNVTLFYLRIRIEQGASQELYHAADVIVRILTVASKRKRRAKLWRTGYTWTWWQRTASCGMSTRMTGFCRSVHGLRWLRQSGLIRTKHLRPYAT